MINTGKRTSIRSNVTREEKKRNAPQRTPEQERRNAQARIRRAKKQEAEMAATMAIIIAEREERMARGEAM